jgi:uncharacterized protein (TIGR02300 family)
LAKPEWGIKRICQACSIRYYDFDKHPIVCPGCGSGFDPEAVLKSRRARVAVVDEVKPVAVVEPKAEVKGEDEDEDEDKDEDKEDSVEEDIEDEDDETDEALLDSDDNDDDDLAEDGVVAPVIEDTN